MPISGAVSFINFLVLFLSARQSGLSICAENSAFTAISRWLSVILRRRHGCKSGSEAAILNIDSLREDWEEIKWFCEIL